MQLAAHFGNTESQCKNRKFSVSPTKITSSSSQRGSITIIRKRDQPEMENKIQSRFLILRILITKLPLLDKMK